MELNTKLLVNALKGKREATEEENSNGLATNGKWDEELLIKMPMEYLIQLYDKEDLKTNKKNDFLKGYLEECLAKHL